MNVTDSAADNPFIKPEQRAGGLSLAVVELGQRVNIRSGEFEPLIESSIIQALKGTRWAMTFQEVIFRLEGARAMRDYWIARCPAHNDRNASLSIREGEDGKVLIKCFAGCDYRAIIEALGREPWRRGLVPAAAFPAPAPSVPDHEVIICADSDVSGAGQRAALSAADQLTDEGRKVRIALPAPGNDFNDYLIDHAASPLCPNIP